MTKLYIAVPCYNEEEVLPDSAEKLRAKLNQMMDNGLIGADSRIVFIDDGSRDKTWQLITQLHDSDSIYSGIKLSRNRGHQNALMCGLMTLKDEADAVISIDADLQDDIEVFDEMVEKNELLEHAEYVSNCYGTPRAYVEQKLDEGLNVLLDIEVQGARQVMEKKPEAIKIFVIPPSLEALKKRLEGRGTEKPEAIEARIARAREEIREADFYDYLILNQDVETAAADFSAIISAEQCRFDPALAGKLAE